MTPRHGTRPLFPQTAPQNLIGKLLAFALSSALLALGFMFSLAALVVLAVIGVSLGAWLWWKTRTLRRQMREQARARPNTPRTGGHIIEGEVVRDFSTPADAGRLPG